MNLESIKKDFQRAVERLKEVLQLEKDDVTRDSAIKRFEIAYELAWKLLKALLAEEGIICNSPRSCFKEAFSAGIIEYDNRWLSMIEDRNLTSHVYKEHIADEVYERLPEYLELFKQILS